MTHETPEPDVLAFRTAVRRWFSVWTACLVAVAIVNVGFGFAFLFHPRIPVTQQDFMGTILVAQGLIIGAYAWRHGRQAL